MQRVGMYFSTKPGMEAQYREKHRLIWPSVLEGITRVGIHNYTIFMKGRELFSYFECVDLESAMVTLAADPENQKWQNFMAPYLDVSSGVSDGSTVYLDEVFFAPGYTDEPVPMQRVGMYMRVRPGMQAAYRAAHQEVWPSIIEQIHQFKMRNYCIFMKDCDLFSYFEVEDLERAMATLAQDPENQRWQAAMSPLMDVGSGIKTGASVYLEEVFHLD